MDDHRVWALGADRQFMGYVRFTPLLGGQHLARLTWRGSGRQIGLVTGHVSAEAAHSWLVAEAARVEREGAHAVTPTR